MHGGTQPVGPASRSYRHGRRSRAFPERLLQRFEAAFTDPELLDLRRDVATIEVLVDEELDRLRAGATAEQWEGGRASYTALRTAINAGDRPAMAARLQELGALFDQAVIFQASRQLLQLSEQRRKLVESYYRVIALRASAWTDATVGMLVSAIVQAVRQEERDAVTLQRIYTRFEGVLNRTPLRALVGETTP